MDSVLFTAATGLGTAVTLYAALFLERICTQCRPSSTNGRPVLRCCYNYCELLQAAVAYAIAVDIK